MFNSSVVKHKIRNKIKRISTSYQGKSRLTNEIVKNKDSLFEVNMWEISQFIEAKVIPFVGHTPFPVTEQSLMTAAVCKIHPKYIFEWGTNIGTSARLFYEATKFFNINSEIHSIDLPPDQEHVEHPNSRRGELVRGLERVFLHEGDGVSTALKYISKNDIDGDILFFLDGDHGYESVKRELDLIEKNVPKAHYLLHDTFFQEPSSNYNIGPFLALEEFLSIHGDKFITLNTALGLPGMTFLYRKVY